MTGLPIDSQRLQKQIDALAEISEVPAPAVTRVIFSPQDMQAREFLKGLMAELSLFCDLIRNPQLGHRVNIRFKAFAVQLAARFEVGIVISLPTVTSETTLCFLPFFGAIYRHWNPSIQKWYTTGKNRVFFNLLSIGKTHR